MSVGTAEIFLIYTCIHMIPIPQYLFRFEGLCCIISLECPPFCCCFVFCLFVCFNFCCCCCFVGNTVSSQVTYELTMQKQLTHHSFPCCCRCSVLTPYLTCSKFLKNKVDFEGHKGYLVFGILFLFIFIPASFSCSCILFGFIVVFLFTRTNHR